jgi:hypothetical protein
MAIRACLEADRSRAVPTAEFGWVVGEQSSDSFVTSYVRPPASPKLPVLVWVNREHLAKSAKHAKLSLYLVWPERFSTLCDLRALCEMLFFLTYGKR